MKKARILDTSGGWTLMEVLVALTIISILISVATASYDTLKARVRYAKLSGDMDGIAQAAYNDFTTHDNTWAADVPPGTPPSFMSSNELNMWPTPPCPNWVYSWDNWIGLPANVARVTVRRADWTAIYSYCVQTVNSSCEATDLFGGSPTNLTALDTHDIYCNE